MQSRKSLAAVALGAVLIAGAVPAFGQVSEIFKCRDARGHWTYTNDRRAAEKQKCDLVSSQITVAPAQKGARPPGFPRESSTQKAGATERQRSLLEKELVDEQQALAKAQQALAAQSAVRSGNEANYARVEERLQPYKDTVEIHQKNIQALQRELGNLNR